MNEWRVWFDTRLDNAIEAAEALEKENEKESMKTAMKKLKTTIFKNDFFLIQKFSQNFLGLVYESLLCFVNFLQGKKGTPKNTQKNHS